MALLQLSELKPYLGNFISNDVGDSTLDDTILTRKISEAEDRIKDAWNYGKDSFPVSPTNPLSWLDLILKNINLLLTIEIIISDRAIAKNELFVNQAKSYTLLSKSRFTDLKVGRLNAPILEFLDTQTIETDSFISDLQDSASDTQGLDITADSNPNTTTVTNLALMESAWVRAAARSQGYTVTIDDLSADQLRNYKDLALSFVCPQVHRIANLGNTSFIGDSIINNKLVLALEDLNALRIGKRYRNVFLED